MLRPGSFLWLLFHELRLGWRGGFMFRRGKRPQAGLVITLVFVLFVGALGGVPLGLALRGRSLDDFPAFAPIADMALLMAFTLMLSQTVIGAVAILYERADFDLLLSSPVQPARVLTVRALAMAFNALILFAVLVTPLVVPIAMLSHPAWLMSYGVLGALALTASACGMMLAIGLFKLIGPRRTKVAGQILGALVGAAFFLTSQLNLLIGQRHSEGVWRDVYAAAITGGLRMPGPLAWPAQALLGDPMASAVVLGTGLAIFILVTWTLGRGFAEDAAAAAGVGTSRTRPAGGAVGSFGAGAFRATLVKELRLILRDPGLISQVLLRVLYLIPLVALVLRGAGEHQAYATAGAAAGVTFMAGQVAGSLSWITVSAEDAPELLAASPIPIGRLWRAKLLAALLPLAALLVLPLAGLVWFDPWAGACATLGCAGCAVSVGLINTWLQKPGRRSNFRRRRDAAIAVTIAELAVGMLWGSAVGLAVARQPWALLPLGVALCITLMLRRSEAAILRRLRQAQA